MKDKRNMSNLSAISLLISTMMGTGITFMPYAFSNMGYIGSWLILIVVGIFTFMSLLIIGHLTLKSSEESTFTSLALNVSNFLYLLVNISIFFNCFISNVSFYRFLTDILVTFFPSFGKVYKDVETGRKLLATFIAPILLYISFKKQLVKLKLIGWLSLGSVLFLSLLTILYSFLVDNNVYNPVLHKFSGNVRYGIPFFVPSMICQPSMVEICQNLKNRKLKNIVLISAISSILGIFCYGLVGHCGYSIFGEYVKGHLVEHFADLESSLNIFIRNNTLDKYNWLSKIAVCCMICLLGSGFPIQLVPVSEMVMVYLYGENMNDRRKNVIILFLFIFCYILVLCEQLRIKFMKRVIGAIFSTCVGLIFPFIYYLWMKDNSRKLKYISYCILIFMSGTIIYIVWTIMEDLIKHDAEIFN